MSLFREAHLFSRNLENSSSSSNDGRSNVEEFFFCYQVEKKRKKV